MQIFPSLYNREGGIIFVSIMPILERVFESSMTELQNEVGKV